MSKAFPLFGLITDEKVGPIIRALESAGPKDTVTIAISSTGGADGLFRLLAVMKAAVCDVVTVLTGDAKSSAVAVWLAGKTQRVVDHDALLVFNRTPGRLATHEFDFISGKYSQIVRPVFKKYLTGDELARVYAGESVTIPIIAFAGRM